MKKALIVNDTSYENHHGCELVTNNIHKLLAKNTIDDYIDCVIEFKSNIAGFIQADTDAINLESLNFLENKKKLLELLGGYNGKG